MNSYNLLILCDYTFYGGHVNYILLRIGIVMVYEVFLKQCDQNYRKDGKVLIYFRHGGNC